MWYLITRRVEHRQSRLQTKFHSTTMRATAIWQADHDRGQLSRLTRIYTKSQPLRFYFSYWIREWKGDALINWIYWDYLVRNLSPLCIWVHNSKSDEQCSDEHVNSGLNTKLYLYHVSRNHLLEVSACTWLEALHSIKRSHTPILFQSDTILEVIFTRRFCSSR